MPVKEKNHQDGLTDTNSQAIRDTLRKTVEREQKKLRKRRLLFILIAIVILFWLILFLVLR